MINWLALKLGYVSKRELNKQLDFSRSVGKRLDEHRELVEAIENQTHLLIDCEWHINHLSVQDDYLIRLYRLRHGKWPVSDIRPRPQILGRCGLPEYQADNVDKQGKTKIMDMNMLPHSLESERSVLSGLMADSNKFDKVKECIAAHDFFCDKHQKIFLAMESLAEKGLPLEKSNLTKELVVRDLHDSTGGTDYLADLERRVFSAPNIMAYANIVRERSVLRQMIQSVDVIGRSLKKPVNGEPCGQ